MKLKLLIASILALLSLVGYTTYREYSALKSINSYESCASAKGSTIQESYPATCITRLGARFPQLLSEFPIKNVQAPIGWTKEEKCRGGHSGLDNYICLKSPNFTENPIPITTSGVLIVLAMPSSSYFVGGSSSVDFCQEDLMSSFVSCDYITINDQKIILPIHLTPPTISAIL